MQFDTKIINCLNFILIGDSTVGKSALFQKLTNQTPTTSSLISRPSSQLSIPSNEENETNTKDETLSPTVSPQFKSVLCKYEDKTLNLFFLDTTTTKSRNLNLLEKEEHHAVLFMYDITSVKSFSYIEDYVESLKSKSEENFKNLLSNSQFFLIGTHSDLDASGTSKNRKIDKEKAEKLLSSCKNFVFSDELPCFFEVSLETGENISFMFNSILKSLATNLEKNGHILKDHTSSKQLKFEMEDDYFNKNAKDLKSKPKFEEDGDETEEEEEEEEIEKGERKEEEEENDKLKKESANSQAQNQSKGFFSKWKGFFSIYGSNPAPNSAEPKETPAPANEETTNTNTTTNQDAEEENLGSDDEDTKKSFNFKIPNEDSPNSANWSIKPPQKGKDSNSKQNNGNLHPKNTSLYLKEMFDSHEMCNLTISAKATSTDTESFGTYQQKDEKAEHSNEIEEKRYEIPVHSLILASRSLLVKELIKNNPDLSKIEIESVGIEHKISKIALQMFLNFFYVDFPKKLKKKSKKLQPPINNEIINENSFDLANFLGFSIKKDFNTKPFESPETKLMAILETIELAKKFKCFEIYELFLDYFNTNYIKKCEILISQEIARKIASKQEENENLKESESFAKSFFFSPFGSSSSQNPQNNKNLSNISPLTTPTGSQILEKFFENEQLFISNLEWLPYTTKFAQNLQEISLFSDCVELIKKNFFRLTENNSKCFEQFCLHLSKPILANVLGADDLIISAEKEVDLFLVMSEWAKKVCFIKRNGFKLNPKENENVIENPEILRNELAGLVELIRFPLMTMGEISTIVVPAQLLTYSQIVEVFKLKTLQIQNDIDNNEEKRMSLKKHEKEILKDRNSMISQTPSQSNVSFNSKPRNAKIGDVVYSIIS